MSFCWRGRVEPVRQEDATAVEGRVRKSQEELQLLLRKKEQLQQHLQSCPEDGKAIYRLAQLQLELGQADEFVGFVRSLCKTERRSWLVSCRVLVQLLGRTEDAVSILVDKHREEPENADVCCYLAKLQPMQAEHWYNRALNADRNCSAALLAIADLHRKAERFTEASRLYQVAHQQNRLAPRPLYRLGEALVQDGDTQKGRECLQKVINGEDCAYHVHASITVALSYVLDQEHQNALQYCQHVESMKKGAAQITADQLTLTQLLKGITSLRSGNIDAAIQTLQSAACQAPAGCANLNSSVMSETTDVLGSTMPKQRKWDQTVQLTLSQAEILRGDLAAAARCLDSARRLAGPVCDPDVLIGEAYLHQARQEWEQAQAILRQCLQIDPNSGLALLRMGYVLLCQKQLDRAVQFLQKCIVQPGGKLNFGKAQQGAAHIYLCIAHHWRNLGAAARQAGSSTLHPAADEHFHKGYRLHPDLQIGLSRAASSSRPTLDEVASRLAKGEPSRMVTLDLTKTQAVVLLLYADRAGVGPALMGQSVSAPSQPSRQSHATGGYVASESSSTCPKPAPLLGTVSTAASSSAGPSRNSSDPNLRLGPGGQLSGSTRSCGADAGTLEWRSSLPPDKCLDHSDLDIGECISRGELTLVHRGVLRSSGQQVVVKMMHNVDRALDEQAAEELRAEISITSKLSHPRLVVFFGACLDLNRVALVTLFAPGGNLHYALHVQRRQFGRRERFQLSEDVLEGVSYLHVRSPIIAHFDLKSLNLLLDEEGKHVQICDFGLARELQPSSSSSSSDAAPGRGGSHRYMAPECHDGNPTEKADVWACGCIILEIFSSQLPYAECSNVAQILQNVLVERRGPAIPPNVDAPVQSVVGATLAFEAASRPAIPTVLLRLQGVKGAASVSDKHRFQWSP